MKPDTREQVREALEEIRSVVQDVLLPKIEAPVEMWLCDHMRWTRATQKVDAALALLSEEEGEPESPLRWEHGRWLCSRCERSFGPGLRWHGCGDRTIDHPAPPAPHPSGDEPGHSWPHKVGAPSVTVNLSWAEDPKPEPCPECGGRGGRYEGQSDWVPCPACAGSEPTPEGGGDLDRDAMLQAVEEIVSDELERERYSGDEREAALEKLLSEFRAHRRRYWEKEADRLRAELASLRSLANRLGGQEGRDA